MTSIVLSLVALSAARADSPIDPAIIEVLVVDIEEVREGRGEVVVASSRRHRARRPLCSHHRDGARGTVRDEELGERQVAIVDREEERRAADGVALVNRRARGAQHRRRLRVALLYR